MHRIEIPLAESTVSALEWLPLVESERPTVLLLHGGGADSAALSWGELGATIAAAGYRVIAPDHPGYGKSAPTRRALTQARLVEYVGEVVDALHLDRYVVGGLSLGGGMTLGHALARPDGPDAVMLLGSYGIMPRLSSGWASMPAQLMSWALVRSGAMPSLMRSYASSVRRMERGMRGLVSDPNRRTPELVSAVLEATRTKGALAAFEEWQRDEVLPTRLRTDYSPLLPQLRCPVLLVHGERDGGVPVSYARVAAARIPNARLVVAADAAHWVQRDAPETVADAMTLFLGSLG